MRGRLEHQLRVQKENLNQLKKYPEFLTNYYYTLMASSIENTTARTYINYISKFLDYEVENGKMISEPKDIEHGDVIQYMASLRYVKRYNKVKQSSHAYRAVVWSALNSFFEHCVNDGTVQTNPMKRILRDSAERDDVKRISLTPEQIQRVLKAVEYGVGSGEARKKQARSKERDLCIILMFLYTGMRVTALTEINIDDIDYENRTLTIIDKNEKTHEYYLADDLIECMQEWEHKRLEMNDYDFLSQPFFITNRKKRISDRAVRDLIYKYTSVLGERVSPHKLRSTYGTNLYNETHDVVLVQECMGHSNIRTTRKYIKATGEEKKRAASIMSNVINYRHS